MNRRWPGRWTLARDILSFFGAWALVFMEARRPELREAVLLFAAGVVSVPAGLAAYGARQAGTGGQSTSAPEPAPLPSPLQP